MIRAIFFDLDGTLLPFNEDDFIKVYFELLYNFTKHKGYSREDLYNTLMGGIKKMYKNDGSITNNEAFWLNYISCFGEDSIKDQDLYEEFYKTEFRKIEKIMHKSSVSNQIVKFCKENGLICVLATNPFFPEIATHTRVEFAGLDVNDFDFITVMDNFCYSKPNPRYFQKLLDMFHLKPEEVLMFGNNEVEDAICAESVGIKTYLVDSPFYIKSSKENKTFNVIKLEDVISTIKEHL